MTINAIAHVERKLFSLTRRKKEMLDRGWFYSPFPPRLLEEVGVQFELIEEGLSIFHPMAMAYAPSWVYGVWVSAGRPVENIELRWDIVKLLLVATRDDMREQDMVCSELSLMASVEKGVRYAASNYVDRLAARRTTKTPHEHPTTHQ